MRKILLLTKHTLPWKVLDILELAARVGTRNKTKVFCAGGFVRDILLNVCNFDIDLTVEGDCLSFAKAFADELKGNFVFYKLFNTATVVSKDYGKVDMAMARKEHYQQPAALPKVEPGSIEDDLARRDFTINAMAISLNGNKRGALIDPFKGRKHLQKKIIRVLHDRSFMDDPTRIYRAARFEQRYGFAIEPRTEALIRQAIGLGMLDRLSDSRTAKEIGLIKLEKTQEKIFARIEQLKRRV